MKTQTVVFDIDGVLADFLSGFYEVARGLGFSATFDASQPRAWDTYPGLNPQEVTKVWQFIAQHPQFWAALPSLITPEESDGISSLLADGHRVYFATNRKTPGALAATTEWLKGYIRGAADAPLSVIVTHRKGEFCKVVEADYYIDDKSENVDCAIWMTDGKTKSYVCDQPYNRGQYAPHSSKAKRVLSVAQFLAEVK